MRALIYGGNANFYNIGLYEYGAVVDMLFELAAPGTWVIPSVGPDFGKMMDQAELLRARSFATAMVLPAVAACTKIGVEIGIERFAGRFGRPVILYLKSETYLAPEAVVRMVRGGSVAAIKYAIARDDPRRDRFLAQLVEDLDTRQIISGMGERPAIVHLRDFGLSSFTSGAVCLAPRLSLALLDTLLRKDYANAERLRAPFMPLEDCRDALHPISVLHAAVTLAGIADMGPVLPLMSDLDPTHLPRLRDIAVALRAHGDKPVAKFA